MILPKPTNFSELGQFLNFLRYYRPYISSYLELAEIFYTVFASGIFSWCDICERCYQLIDESMGDLFDDHQVFFFE